MARRAHTEYLPTRPLDPPVRDGGTRAGCRTTAGVVKYRLAAWNRPRFGVSDDAAPKAASAAAMFGGSAVATPKAASAAPRPIRRGMALGPQGPGF